MTEIVLVIHLLIALALIAVVLLQRSEGGALGIGGGGGGGGGGLFSSRGAGNALTRTTAILAVCFFVTSISLTMLARRDGGGTSILDQVAPQSQGEQAPSGGVRLPTLPQAPAGDQAPSVPVQ